MIFRAPRGGGAYPVDFPALKSTWPRQTTHRPAPVAERGEIPNKPYSGKLMLRLPPEVHAHAAMMATAHGKNLNQWAAEVLVNAR